MTNKRAGVVEVNAFRLVAESQTDHDETAPVIAWETGAFNAGHHTGLVEVTGKLRALLDALKTVPPIPEP